MWCTAVQSFVLACYQCSICFANAVSINVVNSSIYFVNAISVDVVNSNIYFVNAVSVQL
jgi:hypothetical protein